MRVTYKSITRSLAKVKVVLWVFRKEKPTLIDFKRDNLKESMNAHGLPNLYMTWKLCFGLLSFGTGTHQ